MGLHIRKLKDLNFDEGFDFALALSPAIPIIMQSERLRMEFMKIFNDEMMEQRKIIREEMAKEKGRQNQDKIVNAQNAFNTEIANMTTRDVAKILPKVLKDYRASVFEALAILCNCTVDEIRKQGVKQGIKAIYEVLKENDFADFLPSAELSESTESSSVMPNSPEPSELSEVLEVSDSTDLSDTQTQNVEITN